MRISDWSSDVCSSDLSGAVAATEISAAAAAHMVDETAPEPMEERLPSSPTAAMPDDPASASIDEDRGDWRTDRSEEHTSLQSLMRISYAVFCLKKKNTTDNNIYNTTIRL